jgi:hypothetical protein
MSSYTSSTILSSALLEIIGYLHGHGAENTFSTRLSVPDGHETVSRLSPHVTGREKDQVQLSHRPIHDRRTANLAAGSNQDIKKENKNRSVPGPQEQWTSEPLVLPGALPGRKEPSGSLEEGEKALEIYIEMLAERQIHLVKILMLLYEAETEITELIAEAAARRAKVTDKIADKWASVLRGTSD